MMGSGEDVQRGDSNQSGGNSSSETSLSSATSGGSGKKKKKGKITLSLANFHSSVDDVQHEGESMVAASSRQVSARTADRTPRQTQHPPDKSDQEYPVLGASGGSSLGQRNVDAAADPRESHQVAQLLPHELLMDASGTLLDKKNVDAVAELARLKAAAAELACLKGREDLMEELAGEGNIELKAEMDMLKKDFTYLLQSYQMKGRLSYYGCRALLMIPTNDFDFKVDFKHIIGQGYIDLALKVVKEIEARRGTGWLLKTTIDFLKTQRLLDRNNLLAVVLEFDNLPETIKSFAEYNAVDLVERDMSPLGVEHNLVTAIYLGRQIYIRAQQHVLDQHDAGKTWGGQFEQKDIYIIQFSRTNISCHIRGSDKNLICSAGNKVLDLKKLHEGMSIKYQINGHYPAHFNWLEIDMNNLKATSIVASAVLEYLPYHVALMPHGAIKFMTETLYDVTEGVWMNHEDFKTYNSVFQATPSGNADWRIECCNSNDPLLKGVYNHDHRTIQEVLKNNAENMRPAEVQGNMRPAEVQGNMRPAEVQGNMRSAEVQGNMRSAGVQSDMRSAGVQGNMRSAEAQRNMRSAGVQGNMSSVGGTSNGSVRTKFQRTRKGKLNFKRHLDVHLHSHMAEKRPLRGLFQAEVYSSTKNDILGDIFSELFKGPTMKLEKHLRPLMKLYRGMRDTPDDDDDPELMIT